MYCFYRSITRVDRKKSKHHKSGQEEIEASQEWTGRNRSITRVDRKKSKHHKSGQEEIEASQEWTGRNRSITRVDRKKSKHHKSGQEEIEASQEWTGRNRSITRVDRKKSGYSGQLKRTGGRWQWPLEGTWRCSKDCGMSLSERLRNQACLHCGLEEGLSFVTAIYD